MPNINHPHIQALHELYQEETQPFRKVHRMIDLFESIVKTYTVVILSEYIKQNKLSDSAKGLLSQGLRTPSLGTWQLFSRVLFEELQKDNYTWLVGEFPEEFLSLDNALNNEKTNVIALRNGYAHGATPTDAQCEEDIKKFEPFLTQLIASKWLGASSLEIRDNKVYLVVGEGELCLHPILLYRNEESAVSFAFFNDIKNDKIGLLNYPLSKHYREKDFYTEFHEHLPLNEWKKSGNNEFYQRIEELTETFKGRTAEREELLHFVEGKNKGYFSIQGNPGIGKSALIAQFFKDLRVNEKLKHIQVVEYFIRRGTAQANTDYLLNYLIKRTDEHFPQGREIRAEDKNTWSLQQQLFSKWRLWAEHSKGNKLLFLIDGLDEGVEDDIVKYLPRENFENVLIIYGSRPGGHRSIDELWSTLPTEYHTKLELSGLSKQDIRALIYEVANKYALERESAWIDAVEKRSQGNPLYLKLLCDALENGSIALNDIKAIPKEIDQFYKEIIGRYAKDTLDGDALLAGLYTFAAAKDYLTMAHLGLINKLGEAQVERVASTLKEVLYENPLTEDVLDYQLFHESFREYLVKEKNKQVQEAAERIIDFCATWQELEGTFEQRYALENYAAHLSESKKELRHRELLALFQNEAYSSTQKKVLKQFDATKKLYQLGLLKAGEVKENDTQLEAALKLVDLKYEEANDAPQIVALVANNEIDLALKRIESFGGSDKEGMQRKFILYMLCLMELTLLETKDKPFRKSSIFRILNHLDEQLPIDDTILDWNDFFPNYFVFQMACEWSKIGIDYIFVYKRTNTLDFDWLEENDLFTDFQFDLLIKIAKNISSDYKKNSALVSISKILAKQGKTALAYECSRGINDKTEYIKVLTAISSELFKQGKFEEAEIVIQDAYKFSKEISNELSKIEAKLCILTERVNQGKREGISSSMQDIYEYSLGIRDEYDKSFALISISKVHFKQGNIKDALSIINDAKEITCLINDEYLKSKVLISISTALLNYGKNEESTLVIQEAIESANYIEFSMDKSNALKSISKLLANQGKKEEAEIKMKEFISCNRLIFENNINDSEINRLNLKLIKKRKFEEFVSNKLESLEIKTRKIYNKSNQIICISKKLTKQGNIDNAVKCIEGIIDVSDKISVFKFIFEELKDQNKIEFSITIIQEVYKCSLNLRNVREKIISLSSISSEFAKLNQIDLAESAIQDAFKSVRHINTEFERCEVLISISVELAKQSKFDKAVSIIQEAFKYSKGIKDEFLRENAINFISIEFAKQGRLEEAIECAQIITSEIKKVITLTSLSTQLNKQGLLEEATIIIKKALLFVQLISDAYLKSIALRIISSTFGDQGNIKESTSFIQKANETAQIICDDFNKIRELSLISTQLAKLERIEESELALQCAIEQMELLSSEKSKNRALSNISTQLAEQGKIDKALKITKCINSDHLKNIAFNSIISILIEKENWKMAESISLKKLLFADRYKYWIDISKKIFKVTSWQKSLLQVSHFQSEEARLFYLKGWTEAVNLDEVDATCLQEALKHLVYDSESIEALLQKYALNQLFFGDASKEQINRLNKTLNIQWAIDIKNQFPSSEEIQKLSTNIEEWLHEITDEDDRDDIADWAKRVKDGKWTEEKFQERLKEKL